MMTEQPCNTTIPIYSSPVSSLANRINQQFSAARSRKLPLPSPLLFQFEPQSGNPVKSPYFPTISRLTNEPPSTSCYIQLADCAHYCCRPMARLATCILFFLLAVPKPNQNYFTMTTHQTPPNQIAHTRITMTYFRGRRWSVKSHIAIAPLAVKTKANLTTKGKGREKASKRSITRLDSEASKQ